jgi:aldose 1-epimerase
MADDRIELTDGGDLAVTVDRRAGSRLASVRWRGSELLVGDDGSAYGWGSYVMAPWAGRIRHGRLRWMGGEHPLPVTMGPHAIHGTVHSTPWEVVHRTPSRVVLRCDLGPDWPFGGHARHAVEVRADSLLETVTVVAADQPMPAWTGVHPWWRRDVEGAAGRLLIHADWTGAARYVRDAEHMVTAALAEPGPRPWDDCFAGVRGVRLEWPGLVELSLDHDARCLVVYDEPQHAICVEPQTAPPDAAHLDPGSVLVPPGGSVSVAITWSFRALAPGHGAGS